MVVPAKWTQWLDMCGSAWNMEVIETARKWSQCSKRFNTMVNHIIMAKNNVN
jgi:hypothetical protein